MEEREGERGDEVEKGGGGDTWVEERDGVVSVLKKRDDIYGEEALC